MKSNRSLVFAAIAVTFLLLMWRLQTREAEQSLNAEVRATNYAHQTTDSVKAEADQVMPPETDSRRASVVASKSRGDDIRRGILHVEDSQFSSDWKRPIVFYGMVIDEEGKPVQEADVHFSWTDTSPAGKSQSDTRSDVNGRFDLSGVAGRLLSVSVAKAGYYTSKRGQTSFDYSLNFSVGVHRPESNNPVAFLLRRKRQGSNLVTSRYGVQEKFVVSVPLNGAAISVDLLSRKVVQRGQLEISQIKPEYLKAKEAGSWAFSMVMPDGGFVEQSDEFPFQAPESGYQPAVVFRFNKGESNWTNALKKSYYITFGQPRRYGWLVVQTGIGMDGARLEYAINPDGSRNLEPVEVTSRLPPPDS